MGGLTFWASVWLRSVKATMLLLFALCFISIPAGLYLPVPGLADAPLGSIGLWFAALVLAVLAFVAGAYRLRAARTGDAEDAMTFLDEITMNLLGILGAGPMSAMLLLSQRAHGISWSDPVIWFALVAALLAVVSAVRMVRHLRGGWA